MEKKITSIHVLNGGEQDCLYKLNEYYYGQKVIKISQEDDNIHVIWFGNGDELVIISSNVLVYKSRV